MIGAMMLVTKAWDKVGIYNIEEFDPETLLDETIAYVKEKTLHSDPRFSLLIVERFFKKISKINFKVETINIFFRQKNQQVKKVAIFFLNF